MSKAPRTITLGRATFNCRCHVCAFFYSREDEYNVLLPFMLEGLLAGDTAIQILDKDHRAERIRRLSEHGIDTEDAEQNGQFDVRTWEDAYLQPGRSDQDAMIAMLQEIGTSGEWRGSGVTRLWANMEWALLDCLGGDDLLEYESHVNDVLPKYDIATVCSYDPSKFRAALMVDVLRTHPQVIVGGILQENPFYAPPAEFLRELESRRNSSH
jgi:DcmR-like sensory protein